MGDKLTIKSKQNIKYLDDIKNYNDAHESDFKQVFFEPNPRQIKSSQVGVFLKDIYGENQVKPVAQIPGEHTQYSCKLNAAIYANSVIDYNSPTNYFPGIHGVKVNGDFANSPNFFLTPNLPPAVEGQTFSAELSGYIAAQKPGTYKVSSGMIAFLKKNALIWVGNNALRTFRKENAQFVVENGVQKKNESFAMVAGEYTPFRIQFSGDAMFDYKTQPIWVNGDGHPISTFARNKNENDLYFYSITPSERSYYKCDIYKGSELYKYKSTAKQQVKLVWQKELDEKTQYVFLDMIGDLCAYDSNYNKINNITDLKNPASKAKYKLKLYPNNENNYPLCIKYPDDTIVPITERIEDLETVTNEEWAQTPNPMMSDMLNKEEQVGNKKISVDRISESKSLFSTNFKYKLCIMRDRSQKKILGLLASTSATSEFYTVEPDLKMNKLFYASTYPENKFLREVPANLQANSNTYTTYRETHSLVSGYTETASSETNTCEKQCNDIASCTHVYQVSNDTANTTTKCLISSNPVPIFLPKQPGSAYVLSDLKIKNKKIQTGDATKDAIYNATTFIPNGYADNTNLMFADYRVETNVLSKTDTPGAFGTDYIVELRNNVSQTTNGGRPISITNINNPMNAGKIEKFTTVVNDSLTKLDQIDAQLAQYGKDQKTVGTNTKKIQNNLTSINKTYLDMSGNQQKYDFTGQTIYALEEDRTMASALLKDDAIYKTEQNNLYVITTLAMATFLVTAILISK